MFWKILLVLSLIWCGFYCYKAHIESKEDMKRSGRSYWESRISEETFNGMTLSSIITIMLGLFVICATLAAPKRVNAFQQEKEFLENYQVVSIMDSNTVLEKKLELNEWLYNAQYTQEHYPFFSFYDESVQDLTPIK